MMAKLTLADRWSVALYAVRGQAGGEYLCWVEWVSAMTPKKLALILAFIATIPMPPPDKALDVVLCLD